jgi:hypothetical protein
MKCYLNKNLKKNTDKSPDWCGFVKDENGNKTHKLSGWNGKGKSGDYISLIIDEIKDDGQQNANIPDDGFPF